MKQQIESILRGAGCVLRKWTSNRKELLEDNTPVDKANYVIKEGQDGKILGLSWSAKNDEFTYTCNHDLNVQYTKRSVLSCISRLFDPLGLLAPIIVRAKAMIQKLWQSQLEWDDPLPTELEKTWKRFREELIELNTMKIARQVTLTDYRRLELHGFSDASTMAYGACVYVRTISHDGKILVKLLCAKSRIAPLKATTIPRLELCGALLLARLIHKVRTALETEIHAQYLWSDSQIVLAWLAAEACSWQTFVSNRVAEIQEVTQIQEWRHIRSEANPADLITRGASPKSLHDATLWWNGPSFLQHTEEQWPVTSTLRDVEAPERKKFPASLITTVNDLNDSIVEKFSNLYTLQRVVAYIFRFRNNSDPKNQTKMRGDLSSDELNHALRTLVKQTQESEYEREIKCLRKGKPIPYASKLTPLNPFLDEYGLIRVGGRIQGSKETTDKKHPWLLPPKHELTKKIIRNEHERLGHAGSQAVLAMVRSKFWPIDGRSCVRSVLHKCVVCFKSKPLLLNAKMGNLPTTRLNPTRPFAVVGIDFAGPIMIKSGPLKSSKLVKGYLCIFVCFVTKAVHLEIAPDLSSPTFLNVLKRFIARRGICHVINSDNGTNFVGTRNELRRIFDFIKNKVPTGEIRDFLLKHEIKWIFIPPRAPHFGGLWEAAVKSVKSHLVRMIGDNNFTYEKLYTIICQIEAILNSRPIAPLSNDPNDLQALTPGHFLIGVPLAAIPDSIIKTQSNQPINLLHQQRRIQAITDHFWKRWSVEYISTLQPRPKWKRDTEIKPKEGDLAVIKEDHLPPLYWKLGRIVTTHPGEDGVVRVVTLKTQNGLIKRSVTKIGILPIAQ